MHDYLTKIIANKHQEVKALESKISELTVITRKVNKSFKQALMGATVIAEIKRRSPSKHHLSDIVDPVSLAKQYVAGGAAAISILTDQFGFNGSLEDLKAVSAALVESPCPVLRKDFIIDSVQLLESVAAGADAVLLIVAVLKFKTAELLQQAKSLGLDVLVEVHNREELEYAIQIGADIIGINNRNLTTFDVDTNTASNLLPFIPAGVVTVAESGIQTTALAQDYLRQGFNALLIGEALVKSDNPKEWIEQCK